MPAAAPATSSSSSVFHTLLERIAAGVYPPGSRLPPERELAQQLSTSRPTLREALKRLGQWRLVAPRRGSGVAVRPASEWSIQALPAYLGALADGAELGSLVRDLLAVRRFMHVEMLRTVGPRIAADALIDARRAVDDAWALREQPARFIREDLRVLRAVLESTRFLPALWLLNDLADVYLQLAEALGDAIGPPADYRPTYHALLDQLEAGDIAGACQLLAGYLERVDQRMLSTIEI